MFLTRGQQFCHCVTGFEVGLREVVRQTFLLPCIGWFGVYIGVWIESPEASVSMQSNLEALVLRDDFGPVHPEILGAGAAKSLNLSPHTLNQLS